MLIPPPRKVSQMLLDWYTAAGRDLPWRRTRDPWKIMVSEIMLQQTRVAAVIPYYQRFLERYPEPADLARAPEPEFLAIWSGLGYYARARNLQRAAVQITEAGAFPDKYEEIRKLPGVGEYTAAAIASICFALPYAVLDGNVMRVLARVGLEKGDIGSSTVRVRLKEHAQRLLDPRRPSDFNQAIMELGATVCLPRGPQCLLCPWREICQARAEGLQDELPVKLKKREPVKLALELFVVEKNGSVLLRQRGQAETKLSGFWELPLAREMPAAHRGECLGSFKHSITHHDYTIEVYRATAVKAPKGFRWFDLQELDQLPVATMTRKALALA